MPVKTVTRTYETFSGPSRHSLQRDVTTNDDIYATEAANRRQDQRIKNDITNKLYRIELDQIKPGLDVQMQTANFRSSIPRSRTRHYSPEPTLQYVPRVQTKVDRRRYSTAGNLDIYRPKTQQVEYYYERPEPQKVEYISTSTALVPYVSRSSSVVPVSSWRARIHDSGRTNDLLNEYELRKQAELRVRGRPANGPRLYASEVSYLPYVSRPRQSSTPPDVYRTTLDARPGHHRVSSTGRKLSDGQYELDQFEKLMKRNFGSGGVNRNKTLLYTSPPYASSYEYVPASSYTYTSLPSSYYTGRPYYSEYYNYPYYSTPYYVSSYAPYHVEKQYEYPLYSPPTRVTAPWNYGGYYDADYYGRSWVPPRYTYSYVR